MRRREVLGYWLIAGSGLAGCRSTHVKPPGAEARPSPVVAGPPARPLSVPATPGFTPADAEFMSGMIPHHAQAIVMATMAPTHGAGRDVAVLCQRIIASQRDEIRMLRTWLLDRSLPAPDSTATRHRMVMNGVEHDMLMPGMLTDDEMAALDSARDVAFDRLFLTGMIKHHQGAIDMVRDLYRHPGAAQDETVFRFSSDVESDQAGEIQRMRAILSTLPR
jgi:uncharacterized protein (DUF305 family)